MLLVGLSSNGKLQVPALLSTLEYCIDEAGVKEMTSKQEAAATAHPESSSSTSMMEVVASEEIRNPSYSISTHDHQNQPQDLPENRRSNGQVTVEQPPPPGEQPSVAVGVDIDPTELVPQLSSSNITYGDLQTTIKVMNAIAALNPKSNHHRNQKDPTKVVDKATATMAATTSTTNQEDGMALYQQSNLRPFRKALALCIEMHQRTMYNGLNEQDHYEHRKQERSLKRQKMSEKDLYRKHIETTALRKGRVDKLQAALQDYEQEERLKLQSMMIPDGHVDTSATSPAMTTTLLLTSNSDKSNNDDDQGNDKVELSSQAAKPAVILPCLRSCYVCKIRYRELHFFYDQLCPTCAALNYEKRYQTRTLEHRVAVVTGARVKIGYQTCLKLLRAHCTVIATTRFPNAAIEAYRKEPDFHQWKHLLLVYGLDLRDVIGIEIFTRYIKQQFATSGIDIIINNACQTIRRPCGYYQPAIQKEQTLWQNADPTHKSLLSSCIEFEQLRRKQVIQSKEAPPDTSQIQRLTNESNAPTRQLTSDDGVTTDIATGTTVDNNKVITNSTSTTATTPLFEVSGISHSAAMSQMIILPEDVGVNDEILPPGISDINGQQLDLRTNNSWLLKMEQVSTPEFMECMYINAMAPFVLNSRLKPLMTHPNTNERPDRYIINVSAMEGKFYRYKTECHPHTNMAKAALNMLTRTSADDLARSHRIYMNSVDTGWINDENPLEKASQIAKTNLFQTPIDEIDAAARILDPIFTGITNGRDGTKVYGKFLKDYKESEW